MKQKELFISLKSKSDIRDIFSRGEKIKSKYLLIRFIHFAVDTERPIQILWAVPRIVETAVKRNHLRRVLKSSLFEVLKHGDLSKPSHHAFKITIIPRLEFSTLANKSRVEDMRNVVSKLFESVCNEPG